MTEPLPVMHALLHGDEELIPGRMYEAMCGGHFEHQRLSTAEVRRRSVCAGCHHAQIEELRRHHNDLVSMHNVLVDQVAELRGRMAVGGL